MDPLPDIAPHDAAALLYLALRAMVKLDNMELAEREYSDPLPRGAISCGEAIAVPSALAVMIWHKFPQLLHADEVANQLAVAGLHSVGGKPN